MSLITLCFITWWA